MAIKEEKIVMHRTDENGDKVLQFPYVKGECIETPVPITAGGTNATTAREACANIGALPLSGGIMTGTLYVKGFPKGVGGNSIIGDGNGTLRVACDDEVYTPNFQLVSPNYDTDNAGGFLIGAAKDGVSKNLMGLPDGRLLWDGKYLLTEASVADYIVESYNDGKNWYEVYKSGKVRQGGKTANGTGTNVTLLKPYANTNYLLTVGGGNSNGNWPYGNVASATQVFVGVRGTGGGSSLGCYWVAEGQGA